MLETLKFVSAAVCKDGLHPTLQHFLIADKSVRASNGILTICAPFPSGLYCAPHAELLVKALRACGNKTVVLTLIRDALTVKAGRFTAVVPCADVNRFPLCVSSGNTLAIGLPIVPVLARLLPFVATDTLRPWACGMLFAGHSVYASNNTMLIEHQLPNPFPAIVNMPREAATALVKLELEPESVQADAAGVTFHLPGGAWMHTKCLTSHWPDLASIFARASRFTGSFVAGACLDSLLGDVATLRGFTDAADTVYFTAEGLTVGKRVATMRGGSNPGRGAYRAEHLLLLRGIATHLGLAAFPDPIPFYGDNMRGCLVGMQAKP